jgi:hypothetical protein
VRGEEPGHAEHHEPGEQRDNNAAPLHANALP